MRILFCNIAWMSEYKGIVAGHDEPVGGGAYVVENGEAHECWNFDPVTIQNDDGSTEQICFGSVETKTSRSGKRQELHLEKIDGCAALKKDDSVEDVLVIFCASRPGHKLTSVVGWYKHATVYRYYQTLIISDEAGDEFERIMNIEAQASDCVLLPKIERTKTKWRVLRRQSGAAFGFGQANVWYGDAASDQEALEAFLERLVGNIDAYDGENWVNRETQYEGSYNI